MSKEIPYHHGDLRAALVKAAAAEIERGGYESLSLRELAASLDVSRAAPYRHFTDRQALLSTLAADGFAELARLYRKVIAAGISPHETLANAGRAYLAFAADRPQLFRLMFASDLFGGGSPDPALVFGAGDCYAVFEGMVAATLDHPDDSTIKAATIAIMSTTYGFALLRMGDRLRPFMVGGLTQSELIDTVLSMKATKLPRAGRQKRRKKS